MMASCVQGRPAAIRWRPGASAVVAVDQGSVSTLGSKADQDTPTVTAAVALRRVAPRNLLAPAGQDLDRDDPAVGKRPGHTGHRHGGGFSVNQHDGTMRRLLPTLDQRP